MQANMTEKAALQSDKNSTNPHVSIENSTTLEDGKSAAFYRRKILVMDLYSLSVASYVQNSIEIGILSNATGKDLQSKLFSEIWGQS